MTISAMAIELPPDIAKRGSIKVALVPNYPPMEFRDPATNTLSGFDIDLGEAHRPQAWRQDRMAGDQLCRVHAVDLRRGGWMPSCPA